MTKRDVPEEWMPVLQARGFEGPQEIANAIAAAGGKTHVTTVGKFLDGEGVASAITVRAVAEALKITEDRARKIRAEVIANQSGLETFHLKAEAAMLTTGQRRIVEGLVDEFIALQEKVSELNRPAHRSATGRLGESTGDGAKQAKVTNLADQRRKPRGSQPNPIPPSMRNRELHAAQDSDEPRGADPAGKDDGEE